MRKLRIREKQLLGCSIATGVRRACEATCPDGVAKEGEQKGMGRHLRDGGRVLWKPRTHQVAPRPAPAPHLQLLTLGGLLSGLGTPHLGKHLLSRAPHQGQVGIDADLRILLGVLVQAGEHGSLPRAKGKPSPRAHPPPPESAMSPCLPWLQQESRCLDPALPKSPLLPDSHLWPDCGTWEFAQSLLIPNFPEPHPRALTTSIGNNGKDFPGGASGKESNCQCRR